MYIIYVPHFDPCKVLNVSQIKGCLYNTENWVSISTLNENFYLRMAIAAQISEDRIMNLGIRIEF